jgi:hypothetical protein
MLRGDRALIVRRSGLVAEALYASETPLRQGALSTIQVASSRDAGSMDGALRLAARTLRIYYGDADPRRFHPNPMARALIRRSRLAQRSVPRLEVSIILPELSADEVLDVEHAADVIKLGGDTIEIQRDGVRYERDPDTSCYIRGKTRPIRFLDPFKNLSSYALRLSTRASAAGEVVRADYLNVIGVRERDAVQLGAGLLPTLAVRRLAGLVDVERFSYPASVEIPPAPTRICPPPKSPAPGGLARHVRAAAASGDPARLVLAASR